MIPTPPSSPDRTPYPRPRLLRSAWLCAALAASVAARAQITLPHTARTTGGAAAPGAQLPTGGEVLVNCGGASLVDSGGETWLADVGWSGASSAFVHAAEIAGTSDDALYRCGREGAAFAYSLHVPPGVYDVTLHFAERAGVAPGARRFDVACEGQPWLDDLDVAADAGTLTATTRTLRATAADGRVDLAFSASGGAAFVNAIELRSPKLLTVSPAAVDFGLVALGTVESRTIALENRGLHPITIDQVVFDTTVGSAQPFTLHLAGSALTGGASDVVHSVTVALAPGAKLVAPLVYAPAEHVPHDLEIAFGGDFEGSPEVRVVASGGTGDPYLHVVLEVEEVIVDDDDDGGAVVVLDGSGSHTHELGHAIASWTWKEDGGVIGSGPVVTLAFDLGEHEVELVIADDNVPPRTLSKTATFRVASPDEVPGALALLHPSADPAALLASPPATAEHAEVVEGLALAAGAHVGGASPAGALVRLIAAYVVPVAQPYTFALSGGVARSLYVDGAPVGGEIELSAGPHVFDARFAVAAESQLPLAVLAGVDGGTPAPLASSGLTHDQTGVLPVVNAMPSSGLEQGGYPVVIQGFGFFPKESVEVHFGSTVFTHESLESWRPDRLVVAAPPGQGTLSVRVRNGNGFGNVRPFSYSPNAPVPIAFQPGPSTWVSQPTCAEWGPDGRLYVGTLSGELVAITFDEAYVATSVATYPGVSALPNHHVLGIAFSPWGDAQPVRAYVAHGHLYQNGGTAFTGPSYYSGQTSRLSGPSFNAPEPVVRDLPTSNHDHGVNGLAFDENGDLLIAVGGNTNAGVKHPNFGDLPESPLSGAIVKARLSIAGFDGDLRYVHQVTGAPDEDQVHGELVALDRDAPVLVHASGLRNPYDLVVTTRGQLYATDNGPNYGFGSASTGPATQASDPETADGLERIESGAYHGHPNRSRARFELREAVFRPDTAPTVLGEHVAPIAALPSSTDGIAEYRATTFGGALRGQLLVQKWNDWLRRVELSPDGGTVVAIDTLEPLHALDVVTGPGGALIGVDYSGNRVQAFLPQDAAAGELEAYDVTPWRGPATGGTRFVVGGRGFGTLANTSVTIGGKVATLTSVTPNRIVGITPSNPAAAGTTLNLTVGVGASFASIAQAYRYLHPVGGAQGVWGPSTPMPESLGEVAAGLINGKIYLVGEGSDRTLAYDLVTRTWTNALAPRPFVGHHHSAEAFEGRLYLIGGLHGGSEGQVQIYDVASDTWSLGAPMPWPAGSVSTCRIGARIYAAGGIVGSTTVDTCAVYNVLTNQWAMRTPMPTQQGRNHAAAGTDGHRFWIFGGRGVGSGDGNWVANGFDTVLVYDPAANAWQSSLDPGSTLAPLPQARGGMGKAVWLNGEFYVFGGETLTGAGGATAQGVYARVDVYDPLANSWRSDTPMPTARHGIYPIRVHGSTYVAAGGTAAGHSASDLLEVFTRP